MPHRRRLRSASTEQLDVPTCRRSTIGGRAFPVAGAKVWNGLSSGVTSASSLSVFKNRLKTYLFRRCYETVWLSITFPFPSHYLPPQNSGPRNSFYCLGHSKMSMMMMMMMTGPAMDAATFNSKWNPLYHVDYLSRNKKPFSRNSPNVFVNGLTLYVLGRSVQIDQRWPSTCRLIELSTSTNQHLYRPSNMYLGLK